MKIKAGNIVWLVLLAIVVLAAGLRFHKLGHLPLWNDESIQLTGISMPYEQLISRHLKGIDHMPPYSYSIQRVFWKPNESVRAAKVPGVLFGMAMVPLAFLAFRRCGAVLGLLAALLTATSFYLVYYSQELRCYIFFGFGLWLFLGTFLGILMTPAGERVSVFRWLSMGFGAVLAGSFHYAAQLVLPPAGVAGALVLLHQWFFCDKRENTKAYAWRLLWIFIVLMVSLAVCYFEMKHFMGGKLQGMMNEVKKSPMPPPSLMYDVFLRFTWGNGWRMAVLLSIIVSGAVVARKRDRGGMLFAAVLCVFSFLLCFYVYPKFGQRPASLASVRYMFWVAWCVMALQVFSIYALWERFKATKVRWAVPAAIAAVWLACTVSAFAHYYQMEAKRMNIATAKSAVEAVGGERLLLLGNTYDMHHLRAAWPTNCTHASLPVFESSEDFDRLGLGELMEQIARTYPDTIIKKSSYEREAAMVAFGKIVEILPERIRVDNDAHAERLYETGLNPMVGKTMEYAYLPEDALTQLAMEEKRTLLLYPGSMPLLPTRSGDGQYVPWRLLQQPLDFEVLHGGEPGTIKIALSMARVGSGTLKVEYGGESKIVSFQPAAHRIVDPQQRKWVQAQLGLQQVASFGHRLPMHLSTKEVAFDLPVEPGTNRFRLTPFNHPVLLAPPPAEYTLQKELP